MKHLMLELKYSLRTIFHPFDGFWRIKREKMGSSKSAAVLLLLLVLTHVFRRQETDFLIQFYPPTLLQSVLEIILPFSLWCVANWCLTTLMDGEGSLKDIFVVAAYAFTPLILLNIPITMMTKVIIQEELTFFSFVDGAVIGWSFILLFFGMMTIHQYSLKKSLFTGVLTLIGMVLIVFLFVLFFNMLQQVFLFVYSIYKEVAFRM